VTTLAPLGEGLLHAAFWLSATVTAYTYVGYPVLIALLARFRPAVTGPHLYSTPPLTVIIAARDEEDCIEAKIRSCLALDYPSEQLEILVVSDGSRDRTEAIVSGFADRGVRLLRLPEPRGKAGALNAAVPEARGEILLFTDASEEIDPDAAREIAARLSDPQIGAASGELHLDSPGGGTSGVGLYWRYEKLIRKSESRFDSTVGVTGGLYGLRRELFSPLDPRTILDDVAIPMNVVLAGYRVVFEPRARALDTIAGGTRREYVRKRRTLAGNYQLLWLHPELLHPGRNRLFWQLLSHKVGRLAVPWCLLVALVSSAALAASGSPLYRAALALQTAFYLLAIIGVVPAVGKVRGMRLPYTFVVLNLAAVGGLIAFLRGRAGASWKELAPRGSA
jgi:cellulose synthase/poly-beta-1,6-N-acetylglucosamine synthase-like glycosyltransferase